MALSDDEVADIRRWARGLAKTWRPLTPDQLELVKRVMNRPRKKREAPGGTGGSNDDPQRDQTLGSTRAA